MRGENNPEVRNSQRERALPLFEQAVSGARDLAVPAENRVLRETKLETRVANSLSPDIAHARKTDGPNSHAAAARVTNIGPTKEGILEVLRLYGPSTDERIAFLYHGLRAVGKQLPESSPSGLRTRRAWLVQNGFVKEVGTGTTKANRPCAIWGLTGEKK